MLSPIYVRFPAQRGKTFTGRGDKLFAWIEKDAQTETLLTTERQLSLPKEKRSSYLASIIHLSHSLLKKFRDFHRRNRFVFLSLRTEQKVWFAAWAVDARGDQGQTNA